HCFRDLVQCDIFESAGTGVGRRHRLQIRFPVALVVPSENFGAQSGELELAVLYFEMSEDLAGVYTAHKNLIGGQISGSVQRKQHWRSGRSRWREEAVPGPCLRLGSQPCVQAVKGDSVGLHVEGDRALRQRRALAWKGQRSSPVGSATAGAQLGDAYSVGTKEKIRGGDQDGAIQATRFGAHRSELGGPADIRSGEARPQSRELQTDFCVPVRHGLRCVYAERLGGLQQWLDIRRPR